MREYAPAASFARIFNTAPFVRPVALVATDPASGCVISDDTAGAATAVTEMYLTVSAALIAPVAVTFAAP